MFTSVFSEKNKIKMNKKFTSEGLPIVTTKILEETFNLRDEKIIDQWCEIVMKENLYLSSIMYTDCDKYPEEFRHAPFFDRIRSYMLLHNQGREYAIEGGIWNGLPKLKEETAQEHSYTLLKYESEHKLQEFYTMMKNQIYDENPLYYHIIEVRSQHVEYTSRNYVDTIQCDLINDYWFLRLQGMKDRQSN